MIRERLLRYAVCLASALLLQSLRFLSQILRVLSVTVKYGFSLECSKSPRAVDFLFRRFAVEVLVVGLRFGAGMVDNTVPMIRGRINCIELQWNTAGIDDVVIRPGWDDYREARSDRRPNAIENRLTGTLLHAKELVELVDFRPDFFLGL